MAGRWSITARRRRTASSSGPDPPTTGCIRRATPTPARLRPELRLHDLRGSKVTELIWRDRLSVAELALHMGWDMDTAAKMMGVYGSKNPDALGGSATNVVALPVGGRTAT